MLLVNLGTPAAPTPEAVKAYLAQFLSDPRVVALPRILWLPVLHGLVLPRRSVASAEKYAQIWTAEGSPLAVHTRKQAALLGADYAMRYGEPSLVSALKSRREVVIPLYPQYSDSATGSVIDLLPGGAKFVRDFHAHPAYMEALAAQVMRHRRHDLLIMSFHGLPKRGAAEYEMQCHKTARLLAARLELSGEQWKVTFQSRFGLAPWLQPYTEPTLIGLARGGRKGVDVFCPGFVSDCLETLEELGITARRRFLEAGGKELNLIPCLNETPEWIAALRQIAASA
ncbi:MAG: ferrochelatase [Betaproteobacteria bacterium]